MTREQAAAELDRAIKEEQEAKEALRLSTERYNRAWAMRDQALRTNVAVSK